VFRRKQIGSNAIATRQTHFWKRIQVILFILTMVASVSWLSLFWQYVETRPKTIQPMSGNVIPLRSHGLVAYITKDEKQRLVIIQYLAWVLGLSVGAIYIFKQPFKDWKQR
jgi:hypothetical protein